MKFAAPLLLALAGLAVADEARPRESAPVRVLAAANATPWLGLTVGVLDDAIRAQVPDLPQGIGFMIATVDPGGPADKAGLKPYDIFWKMGEQWVVNQEQLFTLLRLRKEGEAVKIAVYRSGKSLEVPVTLARMPADQLSEKLPALEAAALAKTMPDVPMKVLDPTGTSASIKAPDGKVMLSAVPGGREVRIVSSEGAVIYAGPVNDPKGISLVPEPWRVRVATLERSLLRAPQTIQRASRPRVPTLADDAAR